MQHTVTLSSQGQMTLPASLREALGLKPKDQITLKLNPITRRVELDRKKSLEESLAELDRFRNSLMTPEMQSAAENNRGKTASELRESYDNSPEGKAHYKEKYGL